jgi:uncharacterized protein YjiK
MKLNTTTIKTILATIAFIFAIAYFSSSSENTITMDNYDFKNPKQYILSTKLNEVSGLTNSKDGKLFAINDEMGVIYKLDPKDGSIIKRFFLGRWTAEADFEGIATSNNYIYTITSDGVLYKFKEGVNEQPVEYDVIKLPFASKFDIEGLCFDNELNGLLIAAKEYAGKKHKNKRAIYFYSFKKNKVEKEALITISLKSLKKEFDFKGFFPSGIAKHPISGNFFLLSARGESGIVEIDEQGNVINARKFKKKLHLQPEGIAFLEDNTMMISDEARGKKPMLTRYNFSN